MLPKRLTSLAVAACLIAASAAHFAEAAAGSARPNVLLCIADDWGWPDAGAYGNQAIKTPGFDRVAAEGVVFEQAFATAPSCTPSRNALLTGQHHWRLGEGIQLWSTLHPKHAVYPQLLAANGYRIGHCRKAWGPGDWQAKGRTKHPFGAVYDDFASFLAADDSQEPFCFTLGAYDPHRPYEPGSGEQSGIDPSQVEVPADLPNDDVTRSDLADYYFEVQRFDGDVARAIAKLESLGLLENTIVIVTGDHGMPFPRHKTNLYDSGTRVPLAIRWGAKVPGGRRVTDLTTLADIAPTLLECVGVAVPAEMTGRSLAGALLSEDSGRVDATRDSIYTGLERHGQTQESPNPGGYPCRAIRTEDYLYIYNFCPDRWPGGTPDGARSFNGRTLGNCDPSPTKRLLVEKGHEAEHQAAYRLAFARRPRHELYDLRIDPAQINNVAADPAYAETLSQLHGRLFQYLTETGDPRVVGDAESLDQIPYRGYRKRAESLPVSARVDTADDQRLIALGADAASPWFVDGKTKVLLVDGRVIESDDPRFKMTAEPAEGGSTVYSFADSKGVLDIRTTVKALDQESATVKVAVTNRGAKSVAIQRIDFFTGELTATHDGVNRQMLLNGFVLGEPTPKFRPEGESTFSSYETLAFASPPLTTGWLTGKHNFGRFTATHLDGRPRLSAWADCDGCLLRSGATRTSDLLFLSVNKHPLAELERFATLAGEVNQVKIWPPRIAWCTWYAGWQRETMTSFRDGMERGIETVIPVIKEKLAKRNANTVRICDDYIGYGDWPIKTFAIPNGLDRLATMIDAAGLTPGVWYAPYWAEDGSKTLEAHPDWFAKTKSGEIWYETGWQPNSRDANKFAVFDTSHPEVVQYFEDTARQWRDCGFRYVSTDFLNWSILPDKFHDPTMTKAEILRAGLEAVKRGLGPDIFYRPINNPLGVAMGVANDTRISGDSHGDNPTAYLRAAEVWFYNRRVWLNDPSAIVCQRWGEKTPVEWARMWMSWMAVAGTVLTYGDTLDDLPEEYMSIYRRIFPNLPVAGRPLDLWENDPYLLWGMAPGEADGPYDLFGVFEIRGAPSRPVQLNLDAVSARTRSLRETPASVPGEYLVWDFWGEQLISTDAEKLSLPRPVRAGRIFALRPNLGRPQLVGTSGHFSCGLIETDTIVWDPSAGTLRGKARGNGGDATVLYFHVPEGFKSLSTGSLEGGLVAKQHSPSVLAVQVPASDKWTEWRLEFQGSATPAADRPYVSGPTATLAP